MEIQFIDIHSHSLKSHSPDVLTVVSNDPVRNPFFKTDNFFSAGIHPWSLPHEHAEWYVYFVRKIAKHEHCVAIGECGLDFHISADRALQREVFVKHIMISEETGLPLIIHCVKAFHDLLQIRKETKPQSPWIIHGFSRSVDTAKQCIEAGCCLSFGKKALEPGYAEVLKAVPDDMIFAETDDSDVDIHHIYRAIADAKGVDITRISRVISENVTRCFKKLIQ